MWPQKASHQLKTQKLDTEGRTRKFAHGPDFAGFLSSLLPYKVYATPFLLLFICLWYLLFVFFSKPIK